jgi:SpoVK/Ycf46/Vps4 family AAA+-type ATPase
MATSEQIKALIQSHTRGDDGRFMSVAMQIAATAARSGHERLAEDLRKLIDAARVDRSHASSSLHSGPPVAIAQPTGELGGLVAASFPKTRLSSMVLSTTLRRRLDRVLEESRQSERLLQHALRPRRKLLLTGPPGTGKSMTAEALAGELGLPLLRIQFHALITKFMGETAAKLNLVFASMQRQKGVYFFDEFDAIGAHRGATNDVGEARRVLNSFLMFLEDDRSEGLIVAATNVVEMLDAALFRRFDDVIEYDKPKGAMIDELVRNRLAAFEISDWNPAKLRRAASKLTHAEIVRACEDAAKDAVLAGEQRLSMAAIILSISLRHTETRT